MQEVLKTQLLNKSNVLKMLSQSTNQNLWKGLKTQVRKYQPKNITELKVIYREEQSNVSVDCCKNLVSSDKNCIWKYCWLKVMQPSIKYIFLKKTFLPLISYLEFFEHW